MTTELLNDKDYPIYVRKTIEEMLESRKKFKEDAILRNLKLRRSGLDVLLERGMLSPHYDIMGEVKRCVEGTSRLPVRERTFMRGIIITAASKLIVANNRKARENG